MEAPYGQAYWIISETGIWVCSVVFLYILVGCAIYLNRLGKEKITTEHYLLRICVFSAFFSVARTISDHTVAFVGWRNNTTCEATVGVSTALYAPSLYAVYLFLWYRQREFYSNPVLKHLANKHLIRFSHVIIGMLFLASIAVMVLFQIPEITGWEFKATPSGCRDIADELDVEILPTMLVVISITGQTCLLGLLVYPLFVTKKNQKNMSTLSTPSKPTPQQKGHPLLRKAIEGNWRERESNVSMEMMPRKSHDATECLSDDDVSHNELNFSDGESTDCENDDVSHGRNSAAGLPGPSKHYKRKHDPGRETPQRVSFGSPKRIKIKNLRRRSRNASLKRREHKLTKLIKKVSILASVCIVSDVVATVIQIAFHLPELAYLFVFDVNLLVNLICIVLSFKNWKKILLFRIEKSSKVRTESISSSGGGTQHTTDRSHIYSSIRRKNFDSMSVRSGVSGHTEISAASRPCSPGDFFTQPGDLSRPNFHD